MAAYLVNFRTGEGIEIMKVTEDELNQMAQTVMCVAEDTPEDSEFKEELNNAASFLNGLVNGEEVEIVDVKS